MSEFSQYTEALHEECGVFGMYDKTGETDMVSAVYSALYALQHRGQESCGIALNVDGVLSGHRDLGLVSEVFTKRVLEELPRGAKMATGHVRYATAGQRSRSNAQPMVLHHCKGAMAVCHNGNLVNAPKLRRKLEMSGSIFHGTSDTESIAYSIVEERLHSKSTEEAIEKIMPRLQGAFSCVVMTATKLIAFRDPKGFRPLCLGKTADDAYVVASESCALDSIGAHFVRDIAPGEIVVISKEGVRSITTHCGGPRHICVFEYIYFARPDSVIEGVSVQHARMRAGAYLAKEHPVDADIVIGVPDSGLDAALGYAQESGIPYGIGFIKNTATENSTAADTSVLLMDVAPVFAAMLDDMQELVPTPVIAARFHSALVDAVVNVAELVRATYGIEIMALAGGVFMNRYLMERTLARLQERGFTVALNKELPPNDASISYGQAVLGLQAQHEE